MNSVIVTLTWVLFIVIYLSFSLFCSVKLWFSCFWSVIAWVWFIVFTVFILLEQAVPINVFFPVPSRTTAQKKAFVPVNVVIWPALTLLIFPLDSFIWLKMGLLLNVLNLLLAHWIIEGIGLTILNELELVMIGLEIILCYENVRTYFWFDDVFGFGNICVTRFDETFL